MTHGKYIVIEGSDGTGKTTQATILQQQLQAAGVDTVLLHEPGGTPIADALRAIIVDKSLPRSPLTNLLLFTAARHELTPIIEQHLTHGKWVIASRNWLSTLAYQGHGEGVPAELITSITAQFTSPSYRTPDLTLVLALATDSRRTRITNRNTNYATDTFEAKDAKFHRTLDEGYLRIANEQQLPLIDATQPVEAVAQSIWQHVSPLLPATPKFDNVRHT